MGGPNVTYQIACPLEPEQPCLFRVGDGVTLYIDPMPDGSYPEIVCIMCRYAFKMNVTGTQRQL